MAISEAIFATIIQIPDFRDSSSVIFTPQSHEVRPSTLLQLPSKKDSFAKAEFGLNEEKTTEKEAMIRPITRSFFSIFFIMNPF